MEKMLSLPLPSMMLLALTWNASATYTLHAAEDVPFPNDPKWPSVMLESSHSHEMIAEEDIFAYTQLIFQSVYKQRLTDRFQSPSITKLLSEWSQLCLLQVESPTKTAFSFNSGLGYRVKHYEFHLPFEYFNWHSVRASLLVPITLNARFQHKNWTFNSAFNVEFEIDNNSIHRSISLGQTFAEYNYRYGDLILGLHAEHAQTISLFESYRAEPQVNLFFVISADIY